MSADIRIVSTNIAQGTPELPLESVVALDNQNFIHGGHYATLIQPEFSEIYRNSIAYILRDIVFQSTEDTPLPDGSLVPASIFGFNDVGYGTETGQTRILIPSLARPFLPMFDGNQNQALHGYHSRLIHSTNQVLTILESPYRLKQLPPQ